jgi:hypothetical protein
LPPALASNLLASKLPPCYILRMAKKRTPPTKPLVTSKPTSKDSTIPLRKPAKQGTPARVAASEVVAKVDEASLLADLRDLINAARQRVATVANATHTLLCWHVRRRLLRENLHDGRAAYRKRILATLSQQLAAEFGDGFSYSALTRMARFAEVMAVEAIVATLSQELCWSLFRPSCLLSKIRSLVNSTPRCAE